MYCIYTLIFFALCFICLFMKRIKMIIIKIVRKLLLLEDSDFQYFDFHYNYLTISSNFVSLPLFITDKGMMNEKEDFKEKTQILQFNGCHSISSRCDCFILVMSQFAVVKFTHHSLKNQLGLRYEGQLMFMAEPIPHPKRPPRTPLRRSSFFVADVR